MMHGVAKSLTHTQKGGNEGLTWAVTVSWKMGKRPERYSVVELPEMSEG